MGLKIFWGDALMGVKKVGTQVPDTVASLRLSDTEGGMPNDRSAFAPLPSSSAFSSLSHLLPLFLLQSKEWKEQEEQDMPIGRNEGAPPTFCRRRPAQLASGMGQDWVRISSILGRV